MQVLNIRSTSKNQFVDITSEVFQAIQDLGIEDGLCLVFTPHTTAAITINENADPDVKMDILYALSDKFPDDRNFRHNEGNSDAHIKSSIVGCSELLIVEKGKPVLGTWQGIYLCEFDGPRNRNVFIKTIAGK